MALGLDVEFTIKRRGFLHEVSYWWFFEKPPVLRYYKQRGDKLARIFCERFMGRCAGDENEVRGYVKWPFSLVPVIWLTVAADVNSEVRLREYLEYLLSETKPAALLDIILESMNWNLECEQLLLRTKETARVLKEVLELGMMVQREYNRSLKEGKRSPAFDAKKPIEIFVYGNRVKVCGFGTGVPLFTYRTVDGKRYVDTLCSRFECTNANGGIKAVVEGYPVVYALTWSLVAMVLRPYEYEDYLNGIVLSGVPDSVLRTIGFALKGTDELLMFKRRTAEVVKRLVDRTIVLERAKAAGCRRRRASALNRA